MHDAGTRKSSAPLPSAPRGGAPRFYFLVLAYLLILWAWCLHADPREAIEGPAGWLWALIVIVEAIAGFYVCSTILKCADYLLIRREKRTRPPAPPPGAAWPAVGVLYLCCDDFDPEAFESLCGLSYPGPWTLLVHDDGAGAVEERVRVLAGRRGMKAEFFHRPERTGGKPGAVNHVLERIGTRFEYLLFCDNDSFALDPEAIQKALARFSDPRVAAVQFRGVGISSPGDPPARRRLARAVDVFDLFAAHQDRHGMMPFLGHNALVRAGDLREAGGLTPNLLSDDIDLTVRWALSGRTVVYAPEVPFGERVPGSYAAFRLRARKWAFGCGQVIRRHAARVVVSRRLTASQRLGFLEFVGFYAVQVLLLVYLVNAHVLLPLSTLSTGAGVRPSAAGALAGALVLAAIILPTLAFCLKAGRLREWPALAWTCCLVYGSTSFETCRGMLAGLASRRLEWTPTNGAVRRRLLPLACWSELAFGVLLFIVPLAAMPALLLMPVTYLFISNYLFSPIILACYRAGTEPASGLGRLEPRSVGLVLLCVLLALFTACILAAPAAAAEVRVEGDRVLVGGRPFELKGIHYSPWTPGTGPGKEHPYPAPAVIARDLDMIRNANANAILVYDDAPREVFEAAASRGLMVLHVFSINWQTIHDDAAFAARSGDLLAKVEQARSWPNLLAWVLGNEVPEWVYDQRGPDFIAGRIEDLARAVRKRDPAHPITHSNWPITKELRLPSLDIVSFNVYPLWPREVVVRGYESYLRDVLKPLAGGRPLWITEFGISTLETTRESQAATLRRCWEAIRRHAAGGVVFSFADEWWKNYDNPIGPDDFWKREHAPRDEETHDLDPEEYYGITDQARSPKPAYHAVAGMFRERVLPASALFLAPLLLLMTYTVFVFTRRA
ncbi:MAG TPA: glycosyltransferase family 2 protein [Candidatus Polarisedimenticolia bacterium]|nr:glycosyltransferase family 2 protein [Candidatus Polarisedimenticolia bacterium]